jgi:hypothetical protein
MTWRRWVGLGISAWIVVIVALSVIPHKTSIPLATPAGQKAMTVSFTCGPLWGSGYVHGPRATAYPLTSKPCTTRQTERDMTVADVIFGLIVIVVLLEFARRTPSERVVQRPLAQNG